MGSVSARGLRRLQLLEGDLLPESRMQTLWTAVTAAKAQEGASPLLQFGTSFHRRGVEPLARFLESSCAHVRALQLDLRVDSSWQEQDAAEALQRTGFSLSSCRSLRTLTLSLDAPSRPESSNIAVGAALLRTAARNTALEDVVIIIDNLLDRCFETPGVVERFNTLEQSMLNLPHVQRVDLVLAPSDLLAHLPSRVNDISSTVDMLKKHLPRLQQSNRIKTTWTGLNT
ncbi:hypothetical protein PsYK624_122680 [Phanerochaete sordida]|uniref:Uncharacterized protein n=1 Tax=Phanerochaete sordida TaxID=48140 RepID=A0A9P3GM89_9APHY|nr:hypothetical protein PsYK624_122680 [Phanerochaete sordida]